MRRMLVALQQQYEIPENVASYANDEDTDADLNNDTSEFQREVRKPMRLRWGRSTGKAPSEQKVCMNIRSFFCAQTKVVLLPT